MSTETPISTFTFDPPVDGADIQDVCTWLLRVMNKKDKSVVFVASVLTFFLQKGGLSEKQYASLQRVFVRIDEAYSRNALEVQGCVVAHDDGTPTNIVSFSSARGKGGAA